MRSFLGLVWLAATCGLSGIPTAQAAVIGAERLGAAQQTELIHKRQTTTTTGNETFNPLAANNLATYYGRAQSAATLNLNALCSTLDVDVVVLAFLTQFNGLNEIPTLDFGTACSNYGKRTTALSCSVLAQNITYCQSMGVKVFLSVGGASGNISFSSATQATQAATTLWNLFGAGTGATSLRPFGNVTLDGFDFDQETGSTLYYDTMASSLQTLYATSSTTRYISAAPPCANNTVYPLAFYANTNFVWPRFYNAQACGVNNTSGFTSSLAKWYTYMNGVTSAIAPLYPRLYIGALAFNNGVSGFVAPDTFAQRVLSARKSTTSRFGGVTLWEGSDAMVTVDSAGKNFLNVTKTALISTSSGGSLMVDSVVIRMLALLKQYVPKGVKLTRR